MAKRYPELEISLQNFVRKLPEFANCDKSVLDDMRERILATKILPVVPDYRELSLYDDTDDTLVGGMQWQHVLDLMSLDELLPGGQKQLIEQSERLRHKRARATYAFDKYDTRNDIRYDTQTYGQGHPQQHLYPDTRYFTPQREMVAVPGSVARFRGSGMGTTHSKNDLRRDIIGSVGGSATGLLGAISESVSRPASSRPSIAPPERLAPTATHSAVAITGPTEKTRTRPPPASGSPPLKKSKHNPKLDQHNQSTPDDAIFLPTPKAIKFVHWSPNKG